MSASIKASTPPRAKQASRFQSWVFPLAFIGIGVFVALLFGYLQATVVRGAEFDTGSWTMRTFWYRRDPFTGKQLTGILREQPATLTSTTAFPNSYFQGTSSKPPRWDLVRLQSGTALTEGPAYVLNRYMSGYDGGQMWTTWSTANPVKANALWSAVRDLVDLELYYELPKVMELAKVDSTDAEFATMIDAEMNTVLKTQLEKLVADQDTTESSIVTTLLTKYPAEDE